VNLTWAQTQAYCKWAGGRLPTEPEWEYAARAGTTSARYGALDEIAWYRRNSPAEVPAVAQKKANAWGLYDMLGGVWEWTADDHVGYKRPNDVLQQREFREGDKVIRGGHWQSSPEDARASFRLGYDPAGKLNTIGFRCFLPSEPRG
jgi:formylglycine-generating enzyme